MRWMAFVWTLCVLCACGSVEPGVAGENLEGASDAPVTGVGVACVGDGGCGPVVSGCNVGQPTATPNSWCDEQLSACKRNGRAEIDCKYVHEKCAAPSPVPPLPAANTCADQVKLCYAKGADPKGCDALAKQCSDQPPVLADPWCREQIALCEKGGKAEIECKSVYAKCAPPNATVPATPITDCVDQVKLCYARGMAETVCVELQLKCTAVPPQPAPANSWCDDQLAICKKSGDAEPECKWVYEKCAPQPAPTPVPSCDDQVKACYAKGVDAAVCVELERQCRNPEPPSVDPFCMEQLALCKRDADPNACAVFRDKCSQYQGPY